MRLTPEQEEHIVDHANEIVVLLHDDDMDMGCPQLYAALLELAEWLRLNYHHEKYYTADLVERFLTEERESDPPLPEELEDIHDEDDIDPGPITH